MEVTAACPGLPQKCTIWLLWCSLDAVGKVDPNCEISGVIRSRVGRLNIGKADDRPSKSEENMLQFHLSQNVLGPSHIVK